MRMKMLVVAIAAATTLASLGAQAQTADVDQQELAQLRVQLSALQTRIGALEAKQQTQLQAPVAPAEAPLASWAEKTRVGGTLFLDITNIDQAKHGAKTDASGTGFDVKRFYLSIDHYFNDTWSANLTTDASYSSNDGATRLFVKKAYLQGDFSRLASLRVGSASMPWIPLVEQWQGYRFVEKVLVDRMQFGTSTDWGAHLSGDNGVFNYQVSAANGRGYKDPSRSGHVDFEARVGVQPVKGLMFAVGGYDGYLGHDTTPAPAARSARRVDAMTAWQRDGLRLGAEWFRANNWKNVTTPFADSADGWSLWGSYDLARVSLFARHDQVNPSKQLDPNLEDTYWHTGVAFPVTKGVKLAIAYKSEHLRNRSTIDVKTREIGAWGEVKF